jgi:endonuclease YncB( thermonuclease family)
MRKVRLVLPATIGAALLALICAPAFAAGETIACQQGEDGGISAVTAIDGGETLVLEDGRAVRLIGVLGPKRAHGGPAAEVRAQMEAALSALTLGRKVALRLDERKRDRYGRVLAQVTVTSGGGAQIWVQQELVRNGLARVISFQDNRLCITELLAIEDEARRTRKGFWETGFFGVRPAAAEDLLFRLENSYEIVEGRVSDVAEIKGRTYINFGQNWRRDFTAFIPAKSGKLFPATSRGGEAEGGGLKGLKNKRIRVRGWLKNYNGPSITVTHPEQIEIIDGAAAAIWGTLDADRAGGPDG